MEFEFWWLLALPVFFGMGWIAARVDIKSLLSESRALPSSYFRGLNFLLNEQPDKAIESFLQVAKENPQIVELQFALGSLFRRRGEVDRAIRMHQDLVNREDLPPEERQQASFELSQDYFKAGLLDHAEEVLERMGEVEPSVEVHRHLLDIYIQEKDWRKAIDAARKLEVSARRNYQKEIANYYCELGINAQLHGRLDEAEGFLGQALEANRKCVRANILRGEWLARAGKHEAALEAWKAIEQQDPAYFGLAAEGMVESYKALGRPAEGLTLLRGLQHRYPGLDLLNVVYQTTAEIEGDDAAWRLVRDEVRRNPTLVGLDRLIDAELVRAPAERRQDLQLMKNLVHSHAQALAVYLCGNCGFKARQ
ncbi:MAG: lipopolysaccharide assembly protein LapB, partial [Alphaproteobacteria bacterium]|nr:lipopolysaccharide assembly protein LapB [Alphaproteobacteria bacterium]